MRSFISSFAITFIISIIGGISFYFLHIPLAWILGPIVFLLLYKSIFHKETVKSPSLRNVAFVFLGIQIGSNFTSNTLQSVIPYFFPYLLLTLLTIFVAIFSAFLLAKLTKLDKMTSVLGAIPGGLSVMIGLSESFKSNTIYVTLFHSIRLMAVLFLVPFVVTHFFFVDSSTMITLSNTETNGSFWTVIFYILFFIIAKYSSQKIPASYVIIPMLLTAIMNSLEFNLFHLPAYVYIAAQIVLGADLGHSVSLNDIKKAGRYCFAYFILNIAVILFTFFIGYFITLFTSMNLITAILSFAPGGLVEMAITAQEVGGDAAIVGSLQMIRLLIIVLLLPFLLHWMRKKLNNKKYTESKTFIEKTM